ncbi:type II toxin-antitoxin system RelE/ParE family toxin [Candidatus Peregrinibacteria bacterium]|nr:type II toxin-antitoxin system RelE/ParE family toxin [Candidatus Peregrinibacteria bacterium]
MNQRPLRPLEWLGDTRERIREVPAPVQARIGRALMYAQAGETHPYAKPLKGMGSGVFEVVVRYETDTYRAVYAVKIGETVYVLHVFMKKSGRPLGTGIKTPQIDIDLIQRRLKMAQQMEAAKHE